MISVVRVPDLIVPMGEHKSIAYDFILDAGAVRAGESLPFDPLRLYPSSLDLDIHIYYQYPRLKGRRQYWMLYTYCTLASLSLSPT